MFTYIVAVPERKDLRYDDASGGPHKTNTISIRRIATHFGAETSEQYLSVCVELNVQLEYVLLHEGGLSHNRNNNRCDTRILLSYELSIALLSSSLLTDFRRCLSTRPWSCCPQYCVYANSKYVCICLLHPYQSFRLTVNTMTNVSVGISGRLG